MNLQLLSLLIVSGLLLGATVTDLRSRRIPNTLVLYGSALGLCFQALAPASGAGLFPGSEPGLLAGLLGGLTGLGLLLPLYLLRVMGAGDVKLVAMTGVWLGVDNVWHATLCTLLAGGVLAVVVALASGALRQAVHNTMRVVHSALLRGASAGMLVQAPVQTTGRLPYAVAIATGTGVEMARLLAA
ncbi:A24 family peptidase [Azohydromonas aeria]|uniref:A24 family peptidase n=1 Tax=Azohydromonas aeria TaxID=2590212 RepID=UPI001E33817A|nr:prepilin peptidase [Azohydromonas aeria]